MTCTTRRAYDLRLDYTALAPPPRLNEEDAAWAREILSRVTK